MVKQIKILVLALLSTVLTNAQCEIDTINPWFANFQHEPTIECDDALLSTPLKAYDNCDSTVDVIWYEEVTYGNCPNTLDIIRYYRAFDDHGNQAVETQIIHVVDETPPSIVGTPYLEFPDTIDLSTTSFASTYDNCSSVTLMYTDLEVSGGNMDRLYLAIDDCGNVSTFEQIIHLYQIPSDDEDEDEDDDDHNDGDDECGDDDEDDDNSGDNNNRVAICHRLGNGGWITIYVAQPAVPAHLAHGDYLGPCIESNQMLPYTLEKLPNGKVKKYKQCK